MQVEAGETNSLLFETFSLFFFFFNEAISRGARAPKNRAFYVSRFNFGGHFLDKKFVFQNKNFHFFGYSPKTPNFQTILRITVFHVGGYAFGF